MPRQYTLAHVKSLLEKGKVDTGLLKEMDVLMGVTALLAPLAVGLPPGTIHVIVEALGQRGALVKAGELLLEKLKGFGAGDEVAQLERLESAHVLITYTAFFDTVSEMVPGVWKSLASLTETEQFLSFATSAKITVSPHTEPVTAIPHPLEMPEERLERQLAFYRNLAHQLVSVLEFLKILDPAAVTVLTTLRARYDELVQQSVVRYHAQYLELAKTFPEFHIWTGLRYQEALSSEIRSVALLAQSARETLDLGFVSLGKAVAEMSSRNASETMAMLQRRYQLNVDGPIFDRELDELNFPTRRQIFIPQMYRAVRARIRDRLELEETWANAPKKQDLGPFLLSCLKSPYTQNKPILVLGQPGSGKSLLTHMLAVQLASEFDVVRVELRNVEADSDIHSQIVEFVGRDTQGAIVSWPELRKVLTRDAVVILDGFDELLQATGRTHAGYLKKVAGFQAAEAALGRAVRVIVTSRFALIDRAQIPDDVVAIRLESFDAARRQKWIEIWNRTNEAYFSDRLDGTKPFVLPKDSNVRELASQPLLLMMLALYDSKENKLSRAEGLNRTALYHDLIRDFIQREGAKDPDFEDMAVEARAERVDAEMARLGVAALGMFNRDAFSLRAPELERDLMAFGLEKPGKRDDLGELGTGGLFGRFFFVVKSETSARTFAQTSYEFLHATFGEFLAADALAGHIIEECSQLAALSPAKREQNLDNPDYLTESWFEGLMNAPLIRRPVVVQMLSEWLPQKAGEQTAGVYQVFDHLVRRHLAMVLDGVKLPSRFTPLPLLGHAAIYTLNLVTLRAWLVPDAFSIADSKLTDQAGVMRGWDRLTHLWRSWFSLDTLSALPGLICADREGTSVIVRSAREYAGNSKLEIVQAVARAMADNTLAGLAGYFHQDHELEDVGRRLKAEEIDIEAYLQFRRLELPLTNKNRKEYVAFVADWAALRTGDLWKKAVQILASDADSGVEWNSLDTIREMRGGIVPLIRPALTLADFREFEPPSPPGSDLEPPSPDTVSGIVSELQ